MIRKRQPPTRQRKRPSQQAADTAAASDPSPAQDSRAPVPAPVAEPDQVDLDEGWVAGPSPRPRHSPLARLSRMQKVLLVGIVLTGAVFFCTLARQLLGTHSPRSASAVPSTAPQSTGRPATGRPSDPHLTRSPAEVVDRMRPAATGARVEPLLAGPEPLSLQLADQLYQHGDYEHALALYEKLGRRLPAAEENQPLQDLLLLRLALCHQNSGNTAQADTLLRTVSLSRLPVLRAVARYHQSLMLLERRRYLEAATKACQTLALIGVIDYDKKWAAAVQQQCWFLAAEALTRHVLSLSDADKEVPAILWTRHPDIDPFIGTEEAQLRVLLASGVQKLEEALLSPQIHTVDGKGVMARWSVVCNGAPVEELLARFAAHAGFNVRWTDEGRGTRDATSPSAGVDENLRQRPVYLYLVSASAQEVVLTAALSVGLLARLDDQGTVRVLDPASYSSLTDHMKLLAEESVALWRRILLTGENDPRAASGHFAMGLLHTVQGQFDEAVAEYKLLANHFSKHELAPHALLHSGKLKVRLRNYVGAHEDLKQLVELYPDTPLSDQACLYLADATMKAGRYQEATGLYHKVYNLGLSVESQTESALGAGRCFYETGNYEEAANWLNRYIALVRDRNRPEFGTACLWLGQAYLALHKPQQAHAALNLALQGDLSRPQHVQTISALARTYIDRGQFLDALQTLEETAGWQLSQQESVELLVLRAQVLRSIGLMDRAIALLAEKDPYLPSPRLKGQVALELARAYTDAGNLELARKTLSAAFTVVEAGPLGRQIGCELAGACLRLGQPAQAISICSQLLQRAGAGEKEPIRDLLADAYRMQGQYERAVAVLLDGQTARADPNGPSPITGVRATP